MMKPKKEKMSFQYLLNGELVNGSITLPKGNDISAHFQGNKEAKI